MTDAVEFKVAMVRAGTTQTELAKRIGISDMSLYRKINGITEFKGSEISALERLLNLSPTQRDQIFFSPHS